MAVDKKGVDICTLSHQNIALFSSPSLDPAILKQEIALCFSYIPKGGGVKVRTDNMEIGGGGVYWKMFTKILFIYELSSTTEPPLPRVIKYA